MADGLSRAAASGRSVVFKVAEAPPRLSSPVSATRLGGDTFTLRGPGLGRAVGALSTTDEVHEITSTIFSADDNSIVVLLDGGRFLTVDSAGLWASACDPVPLQVEQDGHETYEKQTIAASIEAATGRHAANASHTSVSSDQGTDGSRRLARCQGCTFLVTWHPTHCCHRCLDSGGKRHGPRCDRREAAGEQPSRSAEPEGEPDTGGWGESAEKQQRRGRGQLEIALRMLRGEDEIASAARYIRGNPASVLFIWVERMALAIGNAGHDARNNLRFAQVALERRAHRFANGGRLHGMGHLGHIVGGVGGLGMMGHGMMMGRRAQVEENPNHPRNLDPEYFRKIDALSGQVEGLCRAMVTRARQHRRPAIRERLIPAALGKVAEMEELAARTAGSDQEESQRVEMIRIVRLQRQYLEALDAALTSSVAPTGLPRPDEVLDFSVANAEVEQQLGDLTKDLVQSSQSLKPAELILLARIACNTGHQLQNVAAKCAEEPSCADLAKRVDNLGGVIENQTRNVMVVVHRQEDTGMIPVTSKQKIAQNCKVAWESVEEIAAITTAEQLRANPSAPELAPTMTRLRQAVKSLSDSALIDLENELALPFGFGKPNLRQSAGSEPRLAVPRPADQLPTSSTRQSHTRTFDVVVLGAGPAGVAAAEAAAERGLHCAVVEPRRTGVGAATGFLSKAVHTALVNSPNTAVSKQELRCDVTRQGKQRCQEYGLRTEERLRKAGVQLWRGCGRLTGANSVAVADFDTGEDWEVSTNHIIICCGARPRHPPHCLVDARIVHDYRTIEEVDDQNMPQSVVILGGGVIACETASHMAAFGVQTTLLAPGEILKSADALASDLLCKRLQQQYGVQMHTAAELQAVSADGTKAHVKFRVAGCEQTVCADAVVVAMGSVPNTEWLGLEAIGVQLDGSGCITVDSEMRSSMPHIFACGDCCNKGGLLSQARQQGLLAVAALHRDRSRIWSTTQSEAPMVIWTLPEMASVGIASGRVGTYEVVTYFRECDRGMFDAVEEDFFLKVVYEVQNFPTKVYVKGVHIYGHHAERLISRGADLVGKTLEEAMASPMPAAATMEELYTLNLQQAAKRTVEVGAQRSESCLTA
mmetsp:Transcript_13859/g.25460  ORF Transcript_13859/g.25460 Transcript_13859/m.25460 type:complete len:1103 (-) Transcript_13859:91-3399(-)